MLVARTCAWLARKLGQPAVIGEMAGGIRLGPTLFSGVHTAVIFPAEVRPTLTTLANVGVCVFMFLVGLYVDHRMLSGQGRLVTTLAASPS